MNKLDEILNNSSFDINDTAYFIYNNQISNGEIHYINYNQLLCDIKFKADGIEQYLTIPFNKLYKNKEDLINKNNTTLIGKSGIQIIPNNINKNDIEIDIIIKYKDESISTNLSSSKYTELTNLNIDIFKETIYESLKQISNKI
jgi:hypothetical protein